HQFVILRTSSASASGEIDRSSVISSNFRERSSATTSHSVSRSWLDNGRPRRRKLNILSFIINTHPQHAAKTGTGAMLWHTPGQTSGYSRMSQAAHQRRGATDCGEHRQAAGAVRSKRLDHLRLRLPAPANQSHCAKAGGEKADGL